MRTLFGFILGLGVGVASHWYFTKPEAPETVVEVTERIRSGATNLSQSLKDSFEGSAIKEELARTGKVIRERAQTAGSAIADATADARITAAIKAKLLKESRLASLKIHVSTTGGVVTLSGAVSSHEEIGRALQLALETEGVSKAISTIQVTAP